MGTSASSARSSPLAILVVHGPNLDLLGEREPEIYGRTTLAELDASLIRLGESLGLSVHTRQANAEGTIIDLVHEARRHYAGLVINPGGYTHTSIAIHDALRAVGVPVVEVHLSNLYGRDPRRHVSVTGAACRGVIMGFGPKSYELALRQLADELVAPAPAAS